MHIENPHGVRRVQAFIEQNGAQYPLLDQTAKSTRLLWKRNEAPVTVTFDAGKAKAPNLKEGKARIVVEAVSNDLRGSTDTASTDVNVVLTAPRVIPDDLQHYINQGGMELVTFNATGSWNEAGVKVGKYTFRSFPLPGKGPEQRFSMFAYSWELPPDIQPVVYARNLAGTEATGHFTFKLFPKKFRQHPIEADDKMLEKLVTSVDPTGQLAPGPDLVSRFDKINTELRAKNNAQLYDLRMKTEEKILWNGPVPPLGQGGSGLRRRPRLDARRQKNRSGRASRLRLIRRAERPRASRQRRQSRVCVATSASTATVSCSITAMRCNRSTATCARST